MINHWVTLTSLGLVAVTPPEKRMASENDSHRNSSSTSLNSSSSSNSISNRKSFSKLRCPYDFSEVYDIAHSDQSKEVN